MKKHIVILQGLVLALTLFSCNGDGQGPCEWGEEQFVRMEVVEVVPAEEEDVFYVYLEFDKSILAGERQELSDLRDQTITRAFLEANRIQPGLIYTGIVTERKSGNCDPYYLSWEAGFAEP